MKKKCYWKHGINEKTGQSHETCAGCFLLWEKCDEWWDPTAIHDDSGLHGLPVDFEVSSTSSPEIQQKSRSDDFVFHGTADDEGFNEWLEGEENEITCSDEDENDNDDQDNKQLPLNVPKFLLHCLISTLTTPN